MTSEELDAKEPLRVVLADDDPLIVELLGGWLRDTDFEVVEAFDGASALNACVANQPALVVLDYEMPGYQGAELATFIASQTAAPLIFISSHDETTIIDSAVAAGAYAYLVKPIEEKQFLATVGTAMERAREQRPALILLDRAMPVMDGDETLRRLRAEPATRDIPVIITTGDAADGLPAGAFAVLTKPVSRESLLEAIAGALGAMSGGAAR